MRSERGQEGWRTVDREASPWWEGGKYQGAFLGAGSDQGGDGWESVEEERAVGADGPQN